MTLKNKNLRSHCFVRPERLGSFITEPHFKIFIVTQMETSVINIAKLTYFAFPTGILRVSTEQQKKYSDVDLMLSSQPSLKSSVGRVDRPSNRAQEQEKCFCDKNTG